MILNAYHVDVPQVSACKFLHYFLCSCHNGCCFSDRDGQGVLMSSCGTLEGMIAFLNLVTFYVHVLSFFKNVSLADRSTACRLETFIWIELIVLQRNI